MTLQTDLIQPVNNLHGDIDDAKQALFAAYEAAHSALCRIADAKPHARDYACPARYKDARKQYEAIQESQLAIVQALESVLLNYQKGLIPA